MICRQKKEGKTEKYLAQGRKRESRLLSENGREMGVSDSPTEERTKCSFSQGETSKEEDVSLGGRKRNV